MKQQHIILSIALALVIGVLVWQNTVMAPEMQPGLADTATTTVSEANGNSIVSPDQSEETLPAPGAVKEDEPIMCTMDAKQCPDGSYVGRVAPDCMFTACPNDSQATPKTISCTPEMSAALVCPDIYAPVCGMVQIQCITTPCNPIPETFSNGCSACARGNVISYTEGACQVE